MLYFVTMIFVTPARPGFAIGESRRAASAMQPYVQAAPPRPDSYGRILEPKPGTIVGSTTVLVDVMYCTCALYITTTSTRYGLAVVHALQY